MYKKNKDKKLFTSEPNFFIKGEPQFVTLELKKPIEKYLGDRINTFDESVGDFIKDTVLQTLKHLVYVVTDQNIDQNSIKEIKLVFDPPSYTMVIAMIDGTEIVQEDLSGPFVHIKFDSTFSDHAFMWDDAIISWYFLKVFPDLSRSTLDFWYNLQIKEGANQGLMPREIRAGEVVRGVENKNILNQNVNSVSYPPLSSLQINNPFFLSKIELELFQLYNDKDRLEKVYSNLRDYFLWIERNRRKQDPDTNCFYYEFSNLGSGMDTAMRGYGDFNPQLKNYGWVDLYAQQVSLLQDLEKIQKILGLNGEDLSASAYLTKEFVRCYFDGADRLFWDTQFLGSRNFIKTPHTLAQFWILLVNFESENSKYSEEMVNLLTDPRKFGGYPQVPSISRDDPLFQEEGNYWQGGVWPPMNWIIIKGLELSGYFDIAEILKSETIKLLFEIYEKEKTVFEYYSPTLTLGKPSPGKQDGGLPAKGDFYGWGSIIVGLVD